MPPTLKSHSLRFSIAAGVLCSVLSVAGCSSFGVTPQDSSVMTEQEIRDAAEILSGTRGQKAEAASVITEFYALLSAIGPYSGQNLETALSRTQSLLGGPIPDSPEEINALPPEQLDAIIAMFEEASAAKNLFDFTQVTPADEILTYVRVLGLAAEIYAVTGAEPVTVTFDPESVVVSDGTATIDLVDGVRTTVDGSTENFVGQPGEFVFTVTFDEEGLAWIDAHSFVEMTR